MPISTEAQIAGDPDGRVVLDAIQALSRERLMMNPARN
jgi:hypothetical protein